MAKPNRAAMIKEVNTASSGSDSSGMFLHCSDYPDSLLFIYKHGINRSQCAELPVRRH